LSHPQAIVLVGVIISILTLGVVTVLGSAKDENSSSNTKQFGGHTPGYGTYETTGSVLDPTSLPTDPKNSVVDPMKFLVNLTMAGFLNLPMVVRSEILLLLLQTKAQEKFHQA
jgi:hypothetical protein